MKHYILYIISLLLYSACSADVQDPENLNQVRCFDLKISSLESSFQTRADELHPGKTTWTLGDVVYTHIRFFDENGVELTAFNRSLSQTMREVGLERHFVLDTEFDNTLPLNAKTIVARSFYSKDTTFTFSFDDNVVTFKEGPSGYNDVVVSSDTTSVGAANDTVFINSWHHPLSRIKVVAKDSTYVTLKSINVPKTYNLLTDEFSYSRYKIVNSYCSTADDGFYEYDNKTGVTYTCAFFYGTWDKDEYILTYTGHDIADAIPAFVGKPSDAGKPGVSYLIDLRKKTE